MKKKLAILLILLFCISGVFYSFYNYEKSVTTSAKPVTAQSEQSKQPENTQDTKQADPPKKDVEINITAVGDVLAHTPQLTAQYNSSTKQYDFTNNFTYISPYIKKADLALVNLETTLAGEKNGGYSGYPTFNSPDSLLYALKNTGFNVISAINNHSMDRGSAGVKRTAAEIKSMGLDLLGLRTTVDDNRYLIKEVKGIKIGLISYTFETPPIHGNNAINAIAIPKDVEPLMNIFNPGKPDHDLAEMKEQISLMRKDGAEFIIFFLHWGDEYKRTPNTYQKQMAQALADEGVDIILGSHPHVLEPMQYIDSNISGKKTLVVYSMGNLISNQRYETLNNRYTEDGVIVNIKVKKDAASNKIFIEDTSYVPTWVNKYTKNKRDVYEIIPLTDALKNESSFNINNKNTDWRVKNSYNSTTSLMKETDSSISVSAPLSEESTPVNGK